MTVIFFRVPVAFRAGPKENPICQINDAIPKKIFPETSGDSKVHMIIRSLCKEISPRGSESMLLF